MTLAEKRRKKAELVAQARTLAESARTENRNLSADEQTRFDGFMGEIDTLNQGIAADERFERLDGIEREARSNPGDRVGDPLPHQDASNVGTRHAYSVMKALRQTMQARQGRGRLDGLEAEVHSALSQRKLANSGGAPQGVLIPWDLRVAGSRAEARALDTSAGTGSIPTVLDATMIDLLRNRMVVQAMGATIMNDMQGLFAIPRQSGAGTMYWLAEAGAPTASAQTIDQVAFTPKTAGAFTDYTRRFLEQTNQDAEAFVRNDLASIVARGIDLAALNGSGSSNQPTGVQQNGSVTTVAIGTNGGAPTWANVVGLESAVATANADMGKLGYICNAKLRGTLKQTAKIGSTFPVFLWDGGDTPLNGYPVGVTNQLPSNLTKGSGTGLTSLLFGNWADLIIAFWSGLDVLVDPYTGSSSGATRIVALQDLDIELRHPESFAKCVDILP